MEKQLPFSLKAIVLVGGRGTRLDSVTKGRIPKGFVEINEDKTVRGVDHLYDILTRNEIGNAIFSTRNYSESYEDFVRGTSHTVFYQARETGTSGALEEIFEQFGYEHQYLVISGDVYCHHRNIAKLLYGHVQGTITWGVTPLVYPLMEPYYGLVVDSESRAIIGDIKLPWWQQGSILGAKLYVKGAVNVIDPIVYMDAVSIFRSIVYKENPLDLYWDILPCFEEYNRKRVIAGKKSLLQAVEMDFPFIDYGTPERLELTRRVYQTQVFPVFEPVQGDFVSYEDRHKVHTTGAWHKGIQAHVVRPNKTGTFDVLIQLRSQEVDIGKLKYDQSLATQMLRDDNLSEISALRRGLSFELGISRFICKKLDIQLRIIKTYEEEIDVLNRELLVFFLVRVNEDAQIAALSSKTKQLLWVDWDSLLSFFESNRDQFTKTAQFYLGNPSLRQGIAAATRDFLGIPSGGQLCDNLASTVLLHVDLVGKQAQTFACPQGKEGLLQQALKEWES